MDDMTNIIYIIFLLPILFVCSAFMGEILDVGIILGMFLFVAMIIFVAIVVFLLIEGDGTENNADKQSKRYIVGKSGGYKICFDYEKKQLKVKEDWSFLPSDTTYFNEKIEWRKFSEIKEVYLCENKTAVKKCRMNENIDFLWKNSVPDHGYDYLMLYYWYTSRTCKFSDKESLYEAYDRLEQIIMECKEESKKNKENVTTTHTVE